MIVHLNGPKLITMLIIYQCPFHLPLLMLDIDDNTLLLFQLLITIIIMIQTKDNRFDTLIGKANQLIQFVTKKPNILYPQKWKENDYIDSKEYMKNGNEKQEKACGERKKTYRKKQSTNIERLILGNIIYQRFPGKKDNIWRLGHQNSQKMPKEVLKLEKIRANFGLKFDSRFQSGNLQTVYQKDEERDSYRLILQNDTNTFGYNQWFYFQIINTFFMQKINLQIINMRKKYSLYQKGMKVTIFSQKKYHKQKIGWHKGGQNIQYYQNQFHDQHNYQLYSLNFSYQFEYANDSVFFAYNYPYTYSNLCRQITMYNKDFLMQRLGFSVLRNQILSIEPKPKRLRKDLLGKNEEKTCLIIMGRVHPCQSPSSFVMQGLMEYLLGISPESRYVLSKFKIVLIPMVNPDGVLHGNSRTSIFGCDLNRRWNNTNQAYHPQISSIRNYIKTISIKYKIFAVIDLHAHSRKESTFLYGCCHQQNYPYHHNIRLLNAIIGRIDPNFTSHYSSFFVSSDKASTARVCCNKITPFSYTMESSFMGNRQSYFHYSIQDYRNMGRSLIKAFAYFQETLYPTMTSLLQQNIKEQIKHEITEIKKSPSSNQNEEKQDDSSSNCSLYNYNNLSEFISPELLKINIFNKSNRKVVELHENVTERKINIISKQKRNLSINNRYIKHIQKGNLSDIYELYNFKVRKCIIKQRQKTISKFQSLP